MNSQNPITAPSNTVIAPDEAELFVGFGQECQQKLEDLEDLILALEESKNNLELPKEMYRILHTVKGTAASVGLPKLAKFSHLFEDFIVPIRDGKMQPSDFQIGVMLAATQQLNQAIISLVSGRYPEINENFWEQQKSNLPGVSAKKVANESSKARSISIEIGVIDQLLNYSGNITIIRDIFLQEIEAMAHKFPDEGFFKRGIAHLAELGKENDLLQSHVGVLRKTRISGAFRAPQRAIRDLSVELGKKIKFEVIGANVQIDYDLSQILSDSLVHISRNAIDHGIEFPAERLSMGKVAEAKITFAISKSNDELIVIVSDDGRGIDVERVKRKAIEKNLMTEQALAKMTKDQVLGLIFESGFSTASSVTEVSGRGVGLDMVMKSITDLKGKVFVSSQMNKGSEFKIVIPEKKATNIVNSFVVLFGKFKVAIPTEQVKEIKSVLELKKQNRIHRRGDTLFVSYKKSYAEVIKPIDSPEFSLSDKDLLFILEDSGRAAAILVHEVFSMDKVIVKEFNSGIPTTSSFDRAAVSGRYGLLLFLDLLVSGRLKNVSSPSDLNGVTYE
jgi:two-component system chemotaxis sensor kinase CheA